jgi:hypothetical protein
MVCMVREVLTASRSLSQQKEVAGCRNVRLIECLTCYRYDILRMILAIALSLLDCSLYLDEYDVEYNL